MRSDNLKYIYFQAQLQSQLSWADLALVLIHPAARPTGRPSGLAVNKQETSPT